MPAACLPAAGAFAAAAFGKPFAAAVSAVPASSARRVIAGMAAILPPRVSFRRELLRGNPGLHHDLDRVLDALAGVFQRGRQILEREGVGVDFSSIEPLLRDQR